MTSPEKYCPCVKDHVPNPKVVHRHHIVPKSWGGTDQGPQVLHGSYPGLIEPNVIVLCPSAHENVHLLLNHYVRRDGVVSWDIQQHYTKVERELAAAAWAWWAMDREGTDADINPPYTATRGIESVLAEE